MAISYPAARISLPQSHGQDMHKRCCQPCGGHGGQRQQGPRCLGCLWAAKRREGDPEHQAEGPQAAAQAAHAQQPEEPEPTLEPEPEPGVKKKQRKVYANARQARAQRTSEGREPVPRHRHALGQLRRRGRCRHVPLRHERIRGRGSQDLCVVDQWSAVDARLLRLQRADRRAPERRRDTQGWDGPRYFAAVCRDADIYPAYPNISPGISRR